MTIQATNTPTRPYLYRKGKYVYFRHPVTKQLDRLPDDEACQAFTDAYQELLATVAAAPVINERRVRSVTFKPGSIGWFIERYKASIKFTAMAASTRKAYGIAFDLMGDLVGPAMLHDFTPQAVDVYSKKIADQRSASVADVHTTLISNLWQFAKGFEEFKRGDKHCPTIGRTRHYEHDGEGHLAWPEAVIEAFDRTAKPHLRQVRIGLTCTGQRGVDLVNMKWSDYDGTLINVVQQKTGERLWLHCPEELRLMLDAMPRVSIYIFSTLWGTGFASAASLGGLIRRHCELMGHSTYTMHGLRKNAGMALAMAGCTVPEIMAVLGHRSPKMAMFYVQQADKKRLGRTATIKLNAYQDERRAERVEARRAGFHVIDTER